MNMDDSYIDIIIRWYSEYQGRNVSIYFGNDVKMSLQGSYYVIILMYSVLALISMAGCFYVLFTLLRHRMLDDPTHILLSVLAGYGILMSCFVLPVTLSVTILRTWKFGRMGCTLYPMLQTFPIYGSLLTFLFLLIERYSRSCFQYMYKRRVAAVFCTWNLALLIGVISVGLSAPFSFHVRYVDLENVLGEAFHGIDICSIGIENSHIRKIHLISLMLIYAACCVIPIGLGLLLRAKLRSRKRRQDIDMLLGKRQSNRVDYAGAVRYGSHVILRTFNDTKVDNQKVLQQELLTLKYLQYMQFTYILCWLPLTVITINHQLDHRLEGRDNGVVAEIIYLFIYFTGFFSTVSNSCWFYLWQRSLYRLKNRSRRSCVETVM